MSQFAFLQREWSAVYDSVARAEAAVHADPCTAYFYAWRTPELSDMVPLSILSNRFSCYLSDRLEYNVVYQGI